MLGDAAGRLDTNWLQIEKRPRDASRVTAKTAIRASLVRVLADRAKPAVASSSLNGAAAAPIPYALQDSQH